MKKAGKFISYLLVLAMVTSLLSGLGFKSEKVDAKITAPDFTVLEIVPDKSMGTFGYLVDGYFGLGLTSTDTQATSIYTGNGNLRSYLIGAGLCQNRTDKFVSTNYFENEVLKEIEDVDWNVTVKTRTPADLSESDINSADMIVINQTVPSNLAVSGKVTIKNFRNTPLTAAQVMQIFRKVAGVNGTDPVPYIIDFDLYGVNTFQDVRGLNTMQTSYDDRFGYEPANQEHILTQGGGDFQGLGNNDNQAPNMGTDATSYKLYKLLSTIDPATLYGLYYVCSDGSFGIDEDLNLLELYTNSSNIPSAYNRGGKLTAWTDEYFAPNYLTGDPIYWPVTVAGTSISTVKDKMGWFEPNTGSNQDKGKLDPGKFNKTIGGKKGRGIVFNSDDGIFYAIGIKETITSNIKEIIESFKNDKNDYHPYRYILTVSDTYTNNRSVIADMVKEANSKGIGLPNGIEIKCMSSQQFENLNVSPTETYDGVFTNTTDLLNNFKSLLGNSVGVDYITLPTEYYTNFKPSFVNENGWASYIGSGDIKVTGNKNYINDDAHPNKRSLDFKFRLSGADSYNISLYVDVNGNCKYESTEIITLKSAFTGDTFEESVELKQFYGDEVGSKFVGAFAWRLVIKGGSKTTVYDGVSAVRNAEGKNLIKILQIYPTDYSLKYGEDYKYSSNPALILPTKSEITSIGNVNSLSPVTQFNAVKSTFSGKIKIDVATAGEDHPTSVSSDQTVNISGSDDTKRNHIIIDSSLFYYYLSKLEDYEIDVTRYSVYKFNNTNDIVYNANTGRLGLADGEQKTNLNGSLRYGYTYMQLGIGSDYQTKEVTWTEGKLKKYLIDETNSLIYGERSTEDGKVTYYGASEHGANGEPCKGTSEENEFDILMLGFGSTMDYMKDTKITLIKTYLENGGAAFIGNGTVTMAPNNTLGKQIASVIGMKSSSSAQSGYDYVLNAAIPIMVTNDTILSHYPYSVEKYMRASGGSKQPLELDYSGEDVPVVAFAKYNSGHSDYGVWGDAKHNYYVYKKGNITFCGFGSTFPKAKIDQVGGIMTLAETLMIVNALVAASRFGSGGIPSDPYMNCIDPDRSVIGETLMEDDYEWYHFKDSIYTDYDSYGIAKFQASSDTVFNTPIDSTGMKPEGFTDTTTNVRWIPYKAKLATEDGGYVEFFTTDGKKLPIVMYKYNESTKVFNKLDPVSGTTNKYVIATKGIYYIGVPLDPAAYSGVGSSTKLGFSIDKNTAANNIDMFAIKMNLKDGDTSTSKIVETHTIMMIRRVLYHTS